MVRHLGRFFENQENIRLVSVIAHVDHGKTTLTDSLLAKAGIIDEEQAGSKRGTDTMAEEKERGITIRSTGVSMAFTGVVKKDEDYLVHLVDCPGHVDFSSEVTAALRVSDGAVVVVDCVEGVCVQTETVLRQALGERVKPILVLNKIDRAVLELQLDPEAAYQSFCRTIDSVNGILSSYEDPALGDIYFAPEKGNVVFASGLFTWGVSLPQFARRLANANKGAQSETEKEQAAEKFLKNLWGDVFFDPETKKLTRTVTPGKNLERYACKAFLGPLFEMVKAIHSQNWNEINDKLTKLDITLLTKEREKTGKELMRTIMRKFLPLADSLLEVIFLNLPSPLVAQKYRTEILYDGDQEDEFATSIRECNPNGPMVAFISKMFPVPNTKSFYAFGRVFSGTLTAGQKVYALGQAKTGKKDEHSKNVQRLVPMSIRVTDNLEACPAGNIIALQGIDSLLIKCGTISTSPDASPIKSMKFSVSPVVRAAVSVKYPQDLPKLLDGLKALMNVDPMVQCITEPSGELVIGTAGDLHLQVCMNILRNDYCNGIEIIQHPPTVPFRETVIGNTQEPLLVKSANKHNRLWAVAEPLPAELSTAIENKVFAINDEKARADYLVEKCGWDKDEAKKKIWCFAPEQNATNTLVDATKGVQNLNEIKDSMVGAFSWATGEGPLCGEPMRGVRINVTDAMLHPDAVHHNPRQIMPAMRHLTHACVLAASPRLVEPVYLVEIVTTQVESGNIYNVITRGRGHVFSNEPRFGTPMCTLKAYLPVLSSFGLTAELREATHGQAFAQCNMSHWQVMEGDPLEEGTLPNSIVKEIRARKKMVATIPKVEELVDRL